MQKENLVRGISRIDLIAITINTIIGAGIFGLPSKVNALIGSYSLYAFVACAFIVGFIVLCFAEVSSRFSETGGSYLYAKKAFGSVVGFEVGWLYWIVRVTTFAANCNLLIAYLGFLFPSANQGSTRVLLVFAVVAIIFGVNFVGVRQSVIFTNIFTVGKLVPLVIFIAVGLFFIQPENFTFGAVPEIGAFSGAVLILIYAFVGFEVAAIPAGEIKNPQRNIPIALLTALGIVAVIYILIQIVAVGTLPDLANSQRPLADSATTFLGYFGGLFITIGALISIFGNLNSGFLTSTRIPYAMAEQDELPKVLAKTHSKFKTPHVSLIITAVVILIFTIQSSFLEALTISTITRLIVYATTCAALPVFRFGKDAPEAKFKVPFGSIASIMSLTLTVWLLFSVTAKEFAILGAVIAVGFAIYMLQKALTKKDTATD